MDFRCFPTCTPQHFYFRYATFRHIARKSIDKTKQESISCGANQKNNNQKTKPDQYTYTKTKKQQKLSHTQIVSGFFLAQKQFTWLFGRHIWTKRVFSFWFRACFFPFFSSLLFSICVAFNGLPQPTAEFQPQSRVDKQNFCTTENYHRAALSTCFARFYHAWRIAFGIFVLQMWTILSAHISLFLMEFVPTVFFLVYFFAMTLQFWDDRAAVGKPHARQIEAYALFREREKQTSLQREEGGFRWLTVRRFSPQKRIMCPRRNICSVSDWPSHKFLCVKKGFSGEIANPEWKSFE